MTTITRHAEAPVAHVPVAAPMHPDRRIGIGFPAAALSGPMFESKDIAGFVLAVVITLGPLAAYSFGWGA